MCNEICNLRTWLFGSIFIFLILTESSYMEFKIILFLVVVIGYPVWILFQKGFKYYEKLIYIILGESIFIFTCDFLNYDFHSLIRVFPIVLFGAFAIYRKRKLSQSKNSWNCPNPWKKNEANFALRLSGLRLNKILNPNNPIASELWLNSLKKTVPV